jgi:hypothetical protein
MEDYNYKQIIKKIKENFIIRNKSKINAVNIHVIIIILIVVITIPVFFICIT